MVDRLAQRLPYHGRVVLEIDAVSELERRHLCKVRRRQLAQQRVEPIAACARTRRMIVWRRAVAATTAACV